MQDVGEIVVEPLLRNVAEFSVLVLDSPGGPRASLPQEIRMRPVEEDFIDAQLQIRRFLTRIKVCLHWGLKESLTVLGSIL